MDWLRVSIFCLIATASVGFAQDTVPASESDDDNEVFLIMTSGEPLPDSDAIVVLWKRFERYPEYDSNGDGNWYLSEHGGLTPSEYDHHSQIPPPRDNQATLLGVLEGGIHELGLGQYQEDLDSRVQVLRKGNIVYLMDEDLLHIVDMSNHVIATIDYRMGKYCSPGSNLVSRDSAKYLEECFDLYDVFNSTNVRFRMIKEPKRFELGISQLLNANSDVDDTPIHPDYEVHADWRESPSDLSEWVRLEDGAAPGPYSLMGIALFKRTIIYDYATGELVNVSEGEVPSRRAVLSVLSSFLASDPGLNVHLVASDYGWPDLAWNLSNIHLEEEKE